MISNEFKHIFKTQWYPPNICTHNISFSIKAQKYITKNNKSVQLWKKEEVND